MPKVKIVDYGMGNILSVQRSFEHCGAEVDVVSEAKSILNADYLVLPGVGAFGNAMNELEKLDLIYPIQQFCKKGNPFLGICLGMQMMMDGSEEFGYSKGLGLIPGSVVQIENTTIDNESQKVPHVGWNEILVPHGKDSLLWNNSILNGIEENETMYFVHSYTAKPQEQFRLADSYYGGRRIAAVIKKDHLYGCQFHPEKSGTSGLKIIRNFIEL
ncbi:imidazole glycerol phosphate synthase subunit HisH [Acetobacterium paludosum]|uniref:Imidazole glycerol phosphate synthase subunit HisH n=1 Tax=Acetobacterium paludosum TaxID=52693 RepID=A0A923I1A5_9FIRM|nr:imidazole glycerol phosphate synthase subunit HisH [Acetobacterium paludosum]MBC3888238.1 imidazole glycerol phosphate synthase subunit HisH [Acetobacterium paludosum]